ncbi:MAG: hypothetical protein R2776_02545 [Flavobacteriaceae bacterium]|nr:hypothetical protein [Flavobacteriaceae bacterium]
MNKILFFITLISIASCQEPAKKTPTQEAIAKAYGIDHWDKVNTLNFTFNVDRDTSHFERTFIWEPKTKNVTYMSVTDTVSFHQDSIKRVSLIADKTFINDKYWLLAPFQLLWDKNVTFTEKESVAAPISKETLNVLTITYPSEGGYTPGDAYDFYYGSDFLIKEWVFREKNSPSPSLVYTWEDTQEIAGINFCTMHKDSTGTKKIYFTNLSVN